MKKKFFFLPLLAALVMAGCSKDGTEDIGGGNGEGNGGTHYLAVNIVSSSDMGGRSDVTKAGESNSSDDGSYNPGKYDGTYEDGLPNENTIKKVRFYFFTKGGAAVNVTGGVNYRDIELKDIGSVGSDHDHTVSDKLKAVLVVNTADGDVLPDLMIAVINPPASLPDGSIALDLFRNRTFDYRVYTPAGTTPDNGFVMTNSSFINDNKKKEYITDLSPDYFADSPEAAKLKALEIYVERCVAKVRLSLDPKVRPADADLRGADANGNLIVTDADGTTKHALTKLKYKDGTEYKDLTIATGETDASGNPVTKQVYAELLGWNVSADRNVSWFIKHLDDVWQTTNPGGMGNAWNIPVLHRCFWAAECPSAINTFSDFANSHALPFAGNNYTYCNENAQIVTKGRVTTKVIIPFVLCDENAKPLTICEFAGVRFVDDANLTAMKNQILYTMELGQNEFWTEDGTDTQGATTYRQLNANDIEFVTYYSDSQLNPSERGRYYTKAQLTADAAKRTWYKKNPASKNNETWTTSEFTELLDGFSRIRVWKDGKGYYYKDIPHLGAEGTETAIGVVRNHVYDLKITGLYGLGTPVYNPDQIIIPEPVNPDEVYVAAQVNVLSWRLVSNNIEIDTGK